jgi:tRNA(fMet)-specific endonuclease VapC
VTEPAFLLDSNICIYVLRDAAGAAARRLGECVPGAAVTSAVAYAEVLRGIPLEDEIASAAAGAFFAVIPVLPFDQAAADAYRQVSFKRGTFDRLIAAHAISRGLVFVTNNESDFAEVRGLEIQNWTRE